MKKVKVILVNLILIVVVLISVELICAHTFYREKNFHITHNNWNNEKIQPFWEWLRHNIIFNRKYYFKTEDFRSPSGIDYKKDAVVLTGCSFTYGNLLPENGTFSHILSEYTKRPVYNIALDAASPRETLYILKNDYYRNELLKPANNTKYFIYTYITDQLPRLYGDVYRIPEPVFLYNPLKKELKFINSYNTIFRSYFYFFISRHFAFFIDNKTKFKLFKIYMTEINKEIKKHFTNNGEETKLVILVYEDWANMDWSIFDDEDIIIIKAKDIVKYDLSNPIFKTQDHWHPNSQAWRVLVPKLAEKLNLK